MTVLLNKTLFYHEFRFGMKPTYIYKFLKKLIKDVEVLEASN